MTTTKERHQPIPVVARSKAWVCGCSIAGIAGANPGRTMNVECCQVEVQSLSQRRCNECVCLCVCVCVYVIRCNSNLLHLTLGGRKGQTKKKRKKKKERMKGNVSVKSLLPFG